MAKKLTPMMQQYLDIKEQYKDAILFFRLGDFYEMFFEDAITASRELEITLTGKNCGLDEKAPMCGVPHHAAEGYINKLISKGYKVAIGEQVEDPKLAKGIVKRDVVRVVTPGTNMNAQSLEADKHNYLLCLYQNIANYGLAYVDITTGDFYVIQVTGYQKVLDELAKIQPSEVICNETVMANDLLMSQIKSRFNAFIGMKEDWYFEAERCVSAIKDQLNVAALEGLGFSDKAEGIVSAGALIHYLIETQKSQLNHLSHIQYYETDDFMLLDLSTRRNLELVETLRAKERKGTLLWVLDKTKTAMGARLLRQYIEQPLISKSDINNRLDSVEELFGNPMLREEIREYLLPVYDIERLMSRISCQTANGRDLLAFKQSIGMIQPIKSILKSCTSPLLKDIESQMDDLYDLYESIDAAIAEEPPVTIREGKLLRDGYSEDVDRLRSATTDGKVWLADLEAKERERTGIKNMKVKYNKVFGYYLEVTNSNLHLVPDDYIRKQTMSNGERYITPELKEMENTILGAQEKLVALEYDLFLELRESLGHEVGRIKQSADYLSQVDALQSLAEASYKENFTRPTINEEGVVNIKDGRHPVVEKMMGNDQFISNDTFLDLAEHRFSIITGPNMAGKSTYMRQVALITLMAQVGSFVPASEATISVCDRIFTRVGASDDLASGQSTFMVEMTEVANILRNGTKNSLIILDEIGRGTSTFDGLSIAWAVVEYIVNSNKIGAKTLFATHYHELTELEGKIDGVQNYCISVEEQGDDIIFLRKIIQGGANNSYGIQVAKLAGVPIFVVERAKMILKELDKADITKHAESIQVMAAPEQDEALQLNLFDAQPSELVSTLNEIDINNLTPIEALNLVAKLKSLI